MTTKQRIKQLEKVRGTGAKRYAVEVGGRYFDLTEGMKKLFSFDRIDHAELLTHRQGQNI